jgi:hypothetical protein
MQARYDTADLRTFQRDLKKISPALGRAFNAELGALGREVRDDAKAEFESRFTSQTGDAARAIKSSAARGRVSIFIDGSVARDPKGRPYPVFLHQGWHPRGGASYVPGHDFLDVAAERNYPEVVNRIGDVFDRTVDRYLAKTTGGL